MSSMKLVPVNLHNFIDAARSGDSAEHPAESFAGYTSHAGVASRPKGSPPSIQAKNANTNSRSTKKKAAPETGESRKVPNDDLTNALERYFKEPMHGGLKTVWQPDDRNEPIFISEELQDYYKRLMAAADGDTDESNLLELSDRMRQSSDNQSRTSDGTRRLPAKYLRWDRILEGVNQRDYRAALNFLAKEIGHYVKLVSDISPDRSVHINSIHHIGKNLPRVGESDLPNAVDIGKSKTWPDDIFINRLKKYAREPMHGGLKAVFRYDTKNRTIVISDEVLTYFRKLMREVDHPRLDSTGDEGNDITLQETASWLDKSADNKSRTPDGRERLPPSSFHWQSILGAVNKGDYRTAFDNLARQLWYSVRLVGDKLPGGSGHIDASRKRGENLPKVDDPELLETGKKELQNIKNLNEPILNLPSFVINYTNDKIRSYEKLTGNKTGMTADSKITVTVRLPLHTGPALSGVSMRPEPPIYRRYSVIDIVTGQYIRDLHQIYGIGKFAITKYDNNDLVDFLKKEDLQEKMGNELSGYFADPVHIDGLKKYYTDTMRLRCLEYLASPEIAPYLKQAVTDFIEGKVDAKEVSFHGVSLNGVFFIPHGNSGVLFSVNDPKFFEMPAAKVQVGHGLGAIIESRPVLPKTQEFRDWVLGKIPLYEAQKYENKNEAFKYGTAPSSRYKNLIADPPKHWPITFSSPKNLDALLSHMVDSEKTRLLSDINYFVFTPGERLTETVLEGTKMLLGRIALLAPFIPGGSTGGAWARVLTPLALDGTSATISVAQAHQADRPDQADAYRNEALMTGVLGLLGLGIEGASLGLGKPSLLKPGISVDEAVGFYKLSKSRVNNILKNQEELIPLRRLNGEHGYPAGDIELTKLQRLNRPANVHLSTRPAGDIKLTKPPKLHKPAEPPHLSNQPARDVEPPNLPINDSNHLFHFSRQPVPAGTAGNRTPLREIDAKIPMDDVVEQQGYFYANEKGGSTVQISYDLDAQTWRKFNKNGVLENNKYFLRTDQDQWESLTKEEFSAAQDGILPAATKFKTINLYGIPAIPADATPIPKEIHYIWVGNEIPDHLAANIIKNSTRSQGYKSIVHVDARNNNIFRKISDKFKNSDSRIEVRNLNEEQFFSDFKSSPSGEIYTFFCSDHSINLSAATDSLRYSLINKYGGIYLDTDDAITKNVSHVNLKAVPDDILLNFGVDHRGTGFSGYNTSNFASQPDNQVLKDIINEMNVRFKENKSSLVDRPFYVRGDADSDKKYYSYQKKIFEVTGPSLFNDILKKERPDYYDLGRQTANTYFWNEPPPVYIAERRKALNYYLPFYKKFPVAIGSEQSMSHTR
ncbi:hypothetical protein CIC12_31220 [Burkholderia sp. SG-MS1]|uniref:glycosyltransferase n=1 Tax=Paraburkholderia sp. SG-MS1 TaxID=2023741 RepID=UPI0014486A19|nr:glycosyltransferase [Paraburkholderia sp. SG-MS1]NKJ51115.1 hypothetical protein [Paraburkholderia sp. SG-MS1]